MKYPKSFKMTDKEDGQECEVVYDATKNIYMQDYLDGGIKIARTEREITAIIDAHYDIVKEPVERDLNLPFTVVTDGGNWYDIVEQNRDSVTMIAHDSGEEYHHVTKQMAKCFIKQALWIVRDAPRKATTAPPEPSKEAAKGMDSLTVSVRSEGFTEATEQAKKLAAAIEEVNIALESFQAIFEGTRELLLGNNPSGCVTFCCGDE